jgi:predicted aminopeptidase
MLKMLSFRRPSTARRKWVAAIALSFGLLAMAGCKTIGFYAQAAKGQYEMIAHQKPVEKILSDTNTPAELQRQLRLLNSFRAFAEQELKLPVDGHYRKYVDVHRPFVVWNVEAAPEFSMEPKTWWYPMLGSLSYRGYFAKSGATNYAAALRKKGFDVYVGGVQAYSTLGWFKDPILNTFIFNDESDLAEVIFHELAHQRAFARGDTDFNEAFATTVGQEGARRWLRNKSEPEKYDAYLAEVKRTREFAALVTTARLKLEAIYGDEREDDKVKATRRKRDVPAEELRREKLAVLNQLLADYQKLKASWGGSTQYESWFAREVNNAQLNSVATYYDLVPGFEYLLTTLNGGNLEKFYAATDGLVKMSKTERHEKLHILAQASMNPPASKQ